MRGDVIVVFVSARTCLLRGLLRVLSLSRQVTVEWDADERVVTFYARALPGADGAGGGDLGVQESKGGQGEPSVDEPQAGNGEGSGAEVAWLSAAAEIAGDDGAGGPLGGGSAFQGDVKPIILTARMELGDDPAMLGLLHEPARIGIFATNAIVDVLRCVHTNVPRFDHGARKKRHHDPPGWLIGCLAPGGPHVSQLCPHPPPPPSVPLRPCTCSRLSCCRSTAFHVTR